MTDARKPTVGLIGLGMMGQGMGSNLLRKGFTLTVTAHRDRTGADRLSREGATVVDTPRAVAEASEVVILCVPGSPQVERIVMGTDGLLSAGQSGLTLIDCSTSEPSSTERVAAAVIAAGGRFVDAPLARTRSRPKPGASTPWSAPSRRPLPRSGRCWKRSARTSSTSGRLAPVTS